MNRHTMSDRDSSSRHLHKPGEGRPQRTSATASPGDPFSDIDAEAKRMGVKWIAGNYGDGLYSIVLTFNTENRGWYKGYGTGMTLDEAFQDALEHGKGGK